MVVGAGASVGEAAAEDRGLGGAVDDTKIRVQINDLWFRANADMYRQVTLNILEGRVMLTGQVTNAQARAEAVRLCWQVAGVRDVIDDIEVNPSGEGFASSSSDAIIQQKIDTQLLFDSDIKNVNYRTDVVDGVIHILGIAQNQAELDKVLAHARDISGVRAVANHIILASDPRRVTG